MATETERGLLLFYDWLDVLGDLPGEDFKALIYAMSDYMRNGTEMPRFEGNTKLAAGFIFPALKRRQYLSKQGRKGGLSRAAKSANEPDAPRAASDDPSSPLQAFTDNPSSSLQASSGNPSSSLQADLRHKDRDRDIDKEKDRDRDIDKYRDIDKDQDQYRIIDCNSNSDPDKDSLPLLSPSGGRFLRCEGENEKRSEQRSGQTSANNRFLPPTVEEVRRYCRERNNTVSADEFCDFYTSKGWRIGRDPMKDWRAAVRTWEKRRSGENAYSGGYGTVGNGYDRTNYGDNADFKTFDPDELMELAIKRTRAKLNKYVTALKDTEGAAKESGASEPK